MAVLYSERKGVQKLSLRHFWQCTDALVIALLQDPVDQPNGSSTWWIFSYFWDYLPFSPPILLPPLNIPALFAWTILTFFYSSLILIHAFPFTKQPLFPSTPLMLPSHIGLLTTRFCPVWLTLIWYSWTQQVPLTVRYLSIKLHDITSEKNVIFIFTIMRTWNVTNPHYIYLEIKSRLNQGNYC